MFHGSCNAEPVYLACLWSVYPVQDAVCSPTNQLYTTSWHLNVWISRYLIQNLGMLSLLHGQFSNFYGVKFCLSIPVSMLSIQGLLRILCCPTQRIFLGFFWDSVIACKTMCSSCPAAHLVCNAQLPAHAVCEMPSFLRGPWDTFPPKE